LKPMLLSNLPVAPASLLALDPLSWGMPSMALTAFAFAIALSYQRHINKYGRTHTKGHVPQAESFKVPQDLHIRLLPSSFQLEFVAKSLFLTWLIC